MPLPIYIDDLLSTHSFVWDRLGFKEGWNPEVAIKSKAVNRAQEGTKSAPSHQSFIGA
jgi:hypothetical protein